VAGFIGSPSINLVEAELAQADGRLTVRFGGHELTVDDQLARNRSGLANYVGRTIILGIRPEDFEDAAIETGAPADRRMKVDVDLTEPLGADVLIHFSSEATGVVSSAAQADVGADADVSFAGDDDDEDVTTRLVARVSPRTRAREGSELELVVDTSRLYFFDSETRDAI
jgi:multiple sugar transport system ATP-binding protein